MSHLESILMKLLRFNYDISNDVKDVISRLESDAEEFNNKTLLITGGTGFFGRWLLQTLCTLISERQFNIKIYVLSRNPQKFLDENYDYSFKEHIHFICGDITDFTLHNIQIDYFIHMATTAATETYGGEDQLKKIDLLYRGTRNALENAVKGGVKKVLFTSSGVVYGPSTDYLSESSLQAPKTTILSSSLGEGKRLAEYLVAYFASKSGYSYSIARCFAFAGQYLPLDIHYAFGNFIRDAENNRKISIMGTGEEVRSYLYIGDATVWLLKMLINSSNQIFNVGSSSGITIENLANKIKEHYKISDDVEIGSAKIANDNFTRNFYVPYTDKIKNTLGVIEWTKLDQIILKMKNNDRK